jgi:hypothetical protein
MIPILGFVLKKNNVRSPQPLHQTQNELSGFMVVTAAAPGRPEEQSIRLRCPPGHGNLDAETDALRAARIASTGSDLAP